MTTDLAHRYVQKVANMPKLQHGAVRVGLWLTAVAERTGGFPVEIFYTHLISGYHRDGIDVPGVAFRPETIMKSLQALQDEGLLTMEEGTSTVHGKTFKLCTLNI